MNSQEYYIGIIIIFFSFSLAKLLEGCAELWIRRNNINFYLIHLVWIAIVFLGGFNYIWSFFNEFNRFIDDNIFNFLLFLFPIIIWQLLVFLLFQNTSNYDSTSTFVLEDYFESIRTGVYSLACLFALFTQLIAIVFAHQDETPITIGLRFSIAIMLFSIIFYKNKSIDKKIVWIVLGGVIYFYKVAYSPNTTYLTLTISSNNIELLRKETCVEIDEEFYKINSDDHTFTTRERFKIGNNLPIKIIALSPDAKIVRDSYNIQIKADGKEGLKVDLK